MLVQRKICAGNWIELLLICFIIQSWRFGCMLSYCWIIQKKARFQNWKRIISKPCTLCLINFICMFMAFDPMFIKRHFNCRWTGCCTSCWCQAFWDTRYPRLSCWFIIIFTWVVPGVVLDMDSFQVQLWWKRSSNPKCHWLWIPLVVDQLATQCS